MEISSEHLELIKSCIIQHPRYDQARCRLGDFVLLVYNEASMFLNSISSKVIIKKYIEKIVETHIDDCNFDNATSDALDNEMTLYDETDTTSETQDSVAFDTDEFQSEADSNINEPRGEAPKFTFDDLPDIEQASGFALNKPTPVELSLELPFEKPSTKPTEKMSELGENSDLTFDLGIETQIAEGFNIDVPPPEITPVLTPQDEIIPSSAGTFDITPVENNPTSVAGTFDLSANAEINTKQLEAVEEELSLMELAESAAQFETIEPTPSLTPESELAFNTAPPAPQQEVPYQSKTGQMELPTTPQELVYQDLEDPLYESSTKKVSKELTEKIVGIVGDAHKKAPESQYAKIFYMKYAKKLKQSEIAKMLEISEEELCARYLRLIKIVKSQLR